MIQNRVQMMPPLVRADNPSGPASISGGSLGTQFNTWMKSVNDAQGRADTMSSQLALGDARSLHAVMVASEEASLQLSAVLQVRSKALEAYQEVMRMQV